ncbi:MAG: sensor histidine kinase [Gammaproteobacteria bacterium]
MGDSGTAATIQRETLTSDADNDRIRDPFYLPNFCSSSAVFGAVLMAVLAAIVMTLARVSRWDYFFGDLAKTSLMLVWTALAAAAALCMLRNRLLRLPAVTGSAMTFAVVMAVIAAVSEIVYWLGTVYSPENLAGTDNWFPQNRWYFLSRNVFVGIIITGLGLRYFYVSNQWQRNVESEARTRIYALQARIRPHFLFNSMNTIAQLTRTNPVAAEAAVENLADLFRASLADSHKLIRLGQELEVARIYEDMEQQRLGDRLKVEWRVDDLPVRAKVPSLVLQPLLENAIYHGVERLSEPGIVEIEGRCKGDMIYLSVRNPLPAEKNRSESGHKIALENIEERLTLAFGPRARMSRAVDQTHYQISIAFPLKE